MKEKSSKNSILSSTYSNNRTQKNSINLLQNNLEENDNFEKKDINQNESISSSINKSKNIQMNELNLNQNINLNELNTQDTPKDIREKYKKVNKDKNYSRSIDGNIPKQKYTQYQLGTSGNANNVYSGNDVKIKNSNTTKKK